MSKSPPLHLDTFSWGVRRRLLFQLPKKVNHHGHGENLTPANVKFDLLQQNQEQEHRATEEKQEDLEVSEDDQLKKNGHMTEEEKHDDLKESVDDQPEKDANKRKGKTKLELRFKLTQREIEDDFMELTGHKRPRHRRPNYDPLFPGLSLPRFITMDRYKSHESKKK